MEKEIFTQFHERFLSPCSSSGVYKFHFLNIFLPKRGLTWMNYFRARVTATTFLKPERNEWKVWKATSALHCVNNWYGNFIESKSSGVLSRHAIQPVLNGQTPQSRADVSLSNPRIIPSILQNKRWNCTRREFISCVNTQAKMKTQKDSNWMNQHRFGLPVLSCFIWSTRKIECTQFVVSGSNYKTKKKETKNSDKI